MGESVAALAYWVVFVACWGGLARTASLASRPPFRLSPWGLGLWLAVAAPTLVQLTVVPGLLGVGERESGAVSDGEWWRLVTSLGLQDGGWYGAIFNLAFLAISVALAVEVLGGPAMVGLFVVGGIVCNLLVVATLGQTGAGNSMATIVMVATGAVAALSGWPRWREGLPLLAALVAAAVTMLTMGDPHGIAVALGLVTGAWWWRVRRRRHGRPVHQQSERGPRVAPWSGSTGPGEG